MIITNTYTINYEWTISMYMKVSEEKGGKNYISSIWAENGNKSIKILDNYYFDAVHPIILAEHSSKDNALIIRIVERDENNHDYLIRIKVYDDVVYTSYNNFLGTYLLEKDWKL